MNGSFSWVCMCILDEGHFMYLDVDAHPRIIGSTLSSYMMVSFQRNMLWLNKTLITTTLNCFISVGHHLELCIAITFY